MTSFPDDTSIVSPIDAPVTLSDTNSDLEASPAGQRTSGAGVDLDDRTHGRDTQRIRLQAAAWAGLGYLAFYRAATLIPSGSMIVVGITTIISLFLALLATVLTARALQSSRSIVVSILLSGALALPIVLLQLVVHLAHGHLSGPMAGYYRAAHALFHILPGLDGLMLFWLATSIGAAISLLVREFKILLPMAVALAMVDIYVVFGGGLVTKAQSGHAPVAAAAMSALTVQLPTSHTTRGAAPIPLTVGFADFLFIALFFASFARFRVPSRRTFWLLYYVLVAYGLVVFFAPLPIALPALVPIAAVVVGMNFRRFKYDRSEAFALLYAGILVVGILASFSYFSLRSR